MFPLGTKKDKWGHKLHINICVICKNNFLSVTNDRKFCSHKCISNGSNNGRWKGGRHIRPDGYITVYSPNHPYKTVNNTVLEHRLIMENYIGRLLSPKEEIHHINGIKDDNRIENLMLCSNSSEHQKIHTPKGKKIGSKIENNNRHKRENKA